MLQHPVYPLRNRYPRCDKKAALNKENWATLLIPCWSAPFMPPA